MIQKWSDRVALLAGTLLANLLPVRMGLIAAALVPTFAIPVLAQGARSLGVRPFGPWLWVVGLAMLVRALFVVGVVVVVWRLLAARIGSRPDSAVQILRERYARGEMSEEEYQKRLATLT